MKQLLIYFFLLQHAFVFGQNNITISGKVLDDKQVPVEFANVYLNDASYGTQTNAKGEFQLNIPKGLKSQVVVSSIGYISSTVAIEAEKSQVVNFVLVSQMLNEITVSAKYDKDWRRKWKIFEKAFLGEDASDCIIKNPEVIFFSETSGGQLYATAQNSIIVENKKLGYEIIVDLRELKTDGTTTFLTAQKFFKELQETDGKQKNKWIKNRKKIFDNSFRSFLCQLAKKSIDERQFELYGMADFKTLYAQKTAVATELLNNQLISFDITKQVIYDPAKKNYTLAYTKPILVFLKAFYSNTSPFTDAKYEISQVVLPKGSFSFTENGWIHEPNGLTLTGIWGNEGIAYLLPMNYSNKAENLIDLAISLENVPVGIIEPPKIKAVTPDITPPVMQKIAFVKTKIKQKEQPRNVYYNATHTYILKKEDEDIPLLDLIRRLPGLWARLPDNNTEIGRGKSSSEANLYNFYLIGMHSPVVYWIDGVLYDSQTGLGIIGFLFSKDIEKIELVKDSEAGVFGVLGGTGVIAVYSKKK